MSILRRVRGKTLSQPGEYRRFDRHSNRLVGLVLLGSFIAASCVRAESSAELMTYERADGETFFALSVTPPASLAADRSCDVVVLFDTSASQTGLYRNTALAALEGTLAKLRPHDRVQLLAVDLDARPLTNGFVSADSAALRQAIQALHREPPLGSTDLDAGLRAAASMFPADSAAARAVLYIGDGMSTANLLNSQAFRALVTELRSERIPVSSYAVGPRRDSQLLAALANQTGGNLYVDDEMVLADEADGITPQRAAQENVRRGTSIGETLANWTRATVLWPQNVTYPAALGNVYPVAMPPLRTDRDTVIVGSTTHAITEPVTLELTIESAATPASLRWTAVPKSDGESYAYLAQVVEAARGNAGLTLPTIGRAGLAETGRILENSLDDMTDLAERAVATGDLQSASVVSRAVLRRDPGNVRAQTVQRVVRQPQATTVAANTSASASDDLNLIRTAQVPPQSGNVVYDSSFPVEGAIVDQFDQSGAFLDQVEQQRRVFGQMLRREVENTVIDARRQMSDDPEAASQQLKLALQNVERAPELNPEVRAQLIDKLQIALREVQRAALIKDELDAAREEELAVARERQLVNERLARNIEKEKQLIGRFDALMDERRYDEAHEVARIVEELDPEGVTPRVALVSSSFMRNHYLAQTVRAERWRQYFNALYSVELSSIPFPDEPPIVYPAAPIWEDLTNRRKKYASVDLSAAGGAEERISGALQSPLEATGLSFTETPLEEVVSYLSEEFNIPILLDVPALEDAGLGPDDPITINVNNISLRSALRLMLKQSQLTYVIRDEVLLITTPEEAESELVAKVYPVADLVLPIEVPQIGGGGGGIGGGGGGGLGGGGGGGLGGGGGGFGGGGGGFGGGGGGGGFGGGGGQFSIPDKADAAVATPVEKPALNLSQSNRAKTDRSRRTVASIDIDQSLSPEVFWNQYFSRERDPAAVRQTVRELMGERKFDQAIALIRAALGNGQPQPWMYESLGIAMELAGRPKAEIERVVMSAADFSTTPDELMYIASYMSRSGFDRRALQLCQQVTKLQPLRREAYALGLRSAQRSDDLAGIQWATVGILGQAWTKDEAPIESTATHLAQATLDRLEKEDRDEELTAYREQLDAAVARDCVIQVSWTGQADVDIEVEEPSGTICSLSEPRTTAGGVSLGDGYSPQRDAGSSPVMTETYVCPRGFAGRYRVRIHRVWGEVAAGKVTVDVYRHLGTDAVEHERRQLDLGEKDAMVVFDLDAGRRAEPLEVAQLAGAVERQQGLSRAALAQQLDSLSDESVIGAETQILRRRRAFGALGLGGGAVGFQPIIQVLPEGTMMGVTGVVSADRRYVRISVAPIFSTIGDVQTFTFAGSAEETDMGANAGGGGDMVVPLPIFNQGGGGFGGR